MKTILTFIGTLICLVSIGQIPTLSIQNSEKKQVLEISQLTVSVTVVGNVATTTFDVVFYNPVSRNMEGELSMSLDDGQEICRYALDINGKLREGVIVEKVKARQTFEAVIRQNIDPGIINLTKGNSFKTRIFPIPAKGTKRIVLALSETLKGDDKNLYYSLPLGTSDNIGAFKLDVKVIKSQSNEKTIRSEFENMKFDSQDNAYCLNFERKNYTSNGPLQFTIPRFFEATYQLYTCNFEGETYFYLNVKAPELKQSIKEIPRKIAVYWDNSFSASKRNIKKELNLLESYLTSLKGIKEVTLIAFNQKVSPPQIFQINQDASKIIKSISSLKNDGATCLDDLKFDHRYDEILLFSDAVNTIGEAEVATSNIPVYSITSGSGSNYELLKRLASKTNGEFIDLNAISGEKALEMLKTDEEKFLSCAFNPADIMEIYPNTACRVNKYFELSGILKSDKANLKLNYGTKNKITQTQSFEIHKGSDAPVSRIWASKKIQVLVVDQEKNHEEIMRLARKFNIVTSNTAFIVLDRVEDYVTHGIVPPEEMREEYNKLLALKKNNEVVSPEIVKERNIERVRNLKSWYVNPPQVSKKVKNNTETNATTEVFFMEDVQSVPTSQITSSEVLLSPPAPLSGSVIVENMVADELQITDVESDSRSDTPQIKSKSEASIRVLAWLPDALYLNELRNAGRKNLDSLYYKLKQENLDRPSFYIQVADFFFEKKMKEQAVRVLSNTLELDLENPELLKVVARRLLQEREYETAIKVFKEIKNLRPEEPQSYRDMALVYQAIEHYQGALDIYLYILDHDWNRFEDIKDVVLNELNSLIVLHKGELNLEAINPEYINPMPLDIRITLDWSSNENDIDLWVIDPNGEKCFYSHQNTQIGGKISKDFTRGYGPEEFSLKTAKRGIYTVYVNYFSESRQTITGPVTVYASLITHYGTDQQKTKNITVQLIDNKETRQIGQLEFEK